MRRMILDYQNMGIDELPIFNIPSRAAIADFTAHAAIAVFARHLSGLSGFDLKPGRVHALHALRRGGFVCFNNLPSSPELKVCSYSTYCGNPRMSP